MAEQEQVLVVKRDIFGQNQMFRGLMFEMQPYLDKIFARGALCVGYTLITTGTKKEQVKT